MLVVTEFHAWVRMTARKAALRGQRCENRIRKRRTKSTDCISHPKVWKGQAKSLSRASAHDVDAKRVPASQRTSRCSHGGGTFKRT